MIKAYLDSYNQITLNVSKNYYGGKINSLYMLTKYGPQKLQEAQVSNKFEDYIEYSVRFDENLELGEEYYLVDEHGFKFLLEYRFITKEEQFREDTFTNETLGCVYFKEKTVFTIWAPISKDVILVLNGSECYKMRRQGNIFICSVSKNLDKCEYYFLVKNNGKYVKVLDPYSYAYNFDQSASVVVDLKKVKKNVEMVINKQSKVIYEANVRDFSSGKQGMYSKKFL
jgi:pullulanase